MHQASLVLEGCLVSYGLTKNNRWCERVGRQHKSNSTFLVADICAGVYWQSCWDIDCKGVKSRIYAVNSITYFISFFADVMLQNLLTKRQIPGWRGVPVRAHDDNPHGVFEHHNSSTEKNLKGNQHAWDNSRDFIDAELHEELIWMEAAVACDECADIKTHYSKAAPNCSEFSLADDLGSRRSGSSQVHPICGDVDDWYSSEIEAQISKLEQQRHEIAEAQVVFEVALLHYVHGPDSSSNQR